MTGLKEGFAEVRAEVWRRAKLTKGSEPVVLDLDASLIEMSAVAGVTDLVDPSAWPRLHIR